MGPHDHDLTPAILRWLLEHWVIIGGTVSTMVGGVAYLLHQRFATMEKVEACKDKIINDFTEQLEKHEKRELAQEATEHGAIKAQIRDLHGKIDTVDGKLDQLKNMMLQKEWRE